MLEGTLIYPKKDSSPIFDKVSGNILRVDRKEVLINPNDNPFSITANKEQVNGVYWYEVKGIFRYLKWSILPIPSYGPREEQITGWVPETAWAFQSETQIKADEEAKKQAEEEAAKAKKDQELQDYLDGITDDTDKKALTGSGTTTTDTSKIVQYGIGALFVAILAFAGVKIYQNLKPKKK